MRISDWSSDVCSSDLNAEALREAILQLRRMQSNPQGNILLMPLSPTQAEAAASSIAGDAMPVDMVHSPNAAIALLQRQAHAAVILEPTGIDGPRSEYTMSRQKTSHDTGNHGKATRTEK